MPSESLREDASRLATAASLPLPTGSLLCRLAAAAFFRAQLSRVWLIDGVSGTGGSARALCRGPNWVLLFPEPAKKVASSPSLLLTGRVSVWAGQGVLGLRTMLPPLNPWLCLDRLWENVSTVEDREGSPTRCGLWVSLAGGAVGRCRDKRLSCTIRS